MKKAECGDALQIHERRQCWSVPSPVKSWEYASRRPIQRDQTVRLLTVTATVKASQT